MSYQEFSQKTRSQKFILAHLQSARQFKIFALESGAIYSKAVEHFVSAVEQNGTALVQASSTTLQPGEFFYNITQGVLYVRSFDDSNPKTKNTVVFFKHFYSNIPANLPHDLASGEMVHYAGLIDRIGDLKLELDYENVGIALETDSSISLVNENFDDTFDTHIWENQPAMFYSWAQELRPDEAKLIYKGFINNKSYTPQAVTFNLRDQLSQLKKSIFSPVFSAEDGFVSPSSIGKPKRIVYGRAKQMRTTGVDKVLDGYEIQGLVSGSADLNLLSGSVSGTAGSNTIMGTGTQFLTQIFPDQRIRIKADINEYSFTVQSVVSNTQLTISGTIPVAFLLAEARNLEIDNNVIEGSLTDFRNEVSIGDRITVVVGGLPYSFNVRSIVSPTQLLIEDNIDVGFTGQIAKVKPARDYRRKNRFWHVAGHRLYQFSTEILEIANQNNIKLVDKGDIERDDLLLIDGRVYVVSRVSGEVVTLNQSLPTSVLMGDTVTKTPVQRAFIGADELILGRDFSFSNLSECVLDIFDLAEFNVAAIRNPTLTLVFTPGSRTVTNLTTNVDLTTVFRPRDWIRAKRSDSPTWYEIQQLTETEITLIEVYSDQAHTGQCQQKSPTYISDNTVVTVDCLGKEVDGEWMRFPAHVVRDVLREIDADPVDEDSFEEALSDCPMEVSLFYPTSLTGSLPDCRRVITDINQSCFGSLYIDTDFRFKFSIVNAEKPEDLQPLRDDDILDFSVSTRNSIINEINLEYRPFTDIFTATDTFERVDLFSEFVDRTSQIEKTQSQRCFLYRESDAQTIAERWLLFKSLTQSVVTVRAKLNLAEKSLNDKIFLDLARLYRRYGSSTKKKIGIINMISKDDASVQVRFNDLGNIFNRVAAISPDDQPDYLSSSPDDIAKFGFIVDNETETPDQTENELGNNLIG